MQIYKGAIYKGAIYADICSHTQLGAAAAISRNNNTIQVILLFFPSKRNSCSTTLAVVVELHFPSRGRYVNQDYYYLVLAVVLPGEALPDDRLSFLIGQTAREYLNKFKLNAHYLHILHGESNNKMCST